MDTLCSKCRSIFSTPIKGKLALQWDRVPTETLTLHSDSIASLFASKSLPCHLCVLLWEAKPDLFELLLQTESHPQVRHDPGRAKVRWRWEKTGFLSGGAPSGGNLPDSGRRLAFFIHNPIGDSAEGISVRNGPLELGWWDTQQTKYEQNLVVFGLSEASAIVKEKKAALYNIDEVSPSTNSENCMQLMKSWISMCKSRTLGNHILCNKWDDSRSSWNPTRLLDVGVSGKSSRVRLFQPESGSDPINYVTLSHRWGTQILFTLTTLNIREMVRRIPVRHLCKTFRDAIEITQRLGIRYLWIDSLCIIQNSPQDWRSESARMGDVYKFAYCNLSATRASGGSYDGLYVDRDPLTIKPLLLSAKDSPATEALFWNQAYCIHRGFEEWTEVTNAALNKRAWVLQERIMSPRTLHFCRNQVVFECCSAQCSEKWPRLSARLLDYTDYHHYPLKAAWAGLNTHSTYTTMDFWANIIKHYPTMDLSIGTDKLIALSGIARSVQIHLGNQEYVAGFWSNDLLSQLLWRCEAPAKKVEGGDNNGCFVAPSWSWISAQSRIHDLYPYLGKFDQNETLIELLDYGTTPIHDPLGQITDGFLKVRGKIAKDLLGVPIDPKHSCIGQHDEFIRIKSAVVVAAYFDTDEELPLEEVYCLPLFGIQPELWLLEARTWLLDRMDYTGLLLLETGRGTGEFRRCGMFETQWEGAKLLEKALETASENAATSGIPFEKTKDGNQFVITIV